MIAAAPDAIPVMPAARERNVPAGRGVAGPAWRFAARYRRAIGVTYGLFCLENVARLAQPMLLGLAIDGLLRGSRVGLGLFVTGQAVHMAIRVVRQMYDTRAFNAIYGDIAGALVVAQRARDVDVSVVAARSALARQFVDFFEDQVPVVIQSLFSLLGATVVLLWYDPVLVAFCGLLVVPSLVLNLHFGRRSLRLSALLHDQLEKEVGVITAPDERNVREHYEAAARWRVSLSDNEAITAGVMETFVLLLVVGALARFCTQPVAGAGDIFAVFRYVMLFVTALDGVPMLVNRMGRMRDIGARLGSLPG